MLFHTNFRYSSHALSHLRFPLCTSNWKWLCDKLQMSSGFGFLQLQSAKSFKSCKKFKCLSIFIGLVVVNVVNCLWQFLTTESPLKIMKNIFYFMLKAQFVLEIFTLLSWQQVKVMCENGFIRKPRLISKFMTSKARQHVIKIPIAQYLKR